VPTIDILFPHSRKIVLDVSTIPIYGPLQLIVANYSSFSAEGSATAEGLEVEIVPSFYLCAEAIDVEPTYINVLDAYRVGSCEI